MKEIKFGKTICPLMSHRTGDRRILCDNDCALLHTVVTGSTSNSTDKQVSYCGLIAKSL